MNLHGLWPAERVFFLILIRDPQTAVFGSILCGGCEGKRIRDQG